MLLSEWFYVIEFLCFIFLINFNVFYSTAGRVGLGRRAVSWFYDIKFFKIGEEFLTQANSSCFNRIEIYKLFDFFYTWDCWICILSQFLFVILRKTLMFTKSSQ